MVANCKLGIFPADHEQRGSCGYRVGDKMEDDDWAKVPLRKSKARHKDTDDDSDYDRETKRNKKQGNYTRKLDKYQATRVLNDNANGHTTTNETEIQEKQNGDFTESNENQTTRTQKQTGTVHKSDKYTTRQNKETKPTEFTMTDG